MTNQSLQRRKRWEQLDNSLSSRIENLLEEFRKTYPKNDASTKLILIAAPGRAEIIGNHTDYNEGLTISTNISSNLLFLARKRDDKKGRIRSLSQGNTVHKFTLNSVKDIERKKSFHDYETWTNYVKGVVWGLMQKGFDINGFDAIIESSIPVGAGVSSSAAIALATAHFITEANKLTVDQTTLIDVCKTAENQYVGAPCGYLDQGTIELADNSWLVISYKKEKNVPFTWKQVAMNLQKTGYTLIVGYDPSSKHSLVEGKYELRKNACELSLRPIREILGENTSALGELSVQDFEKIKNQLQRKIEQELTTNNDEKVLRFRLNKHWKKKSFKDIAKNVVQWVSHIVYEDERVSDAISALKRKDIKTFGELLSESGKSAIFGYELNEDSDELSWVYTNALRNKNRWGVLGIRNMGGGFNATTLALVAMQYADMYKNELSELYAKEFNSCYNFLEFTPSPSVGQLDLKHLPKTPKKEYSSNN